MNFKLPISFTVLSYFHKWELLNDFTRNIYLWIILAYWEIKNGIKNKNWTSKCNKN